MNEKGSYKKQEINYIKTKYISILPRYLYIKITTNPLDSKGHFNQFRVSKQ